MFNYYLFGTVFYTLYQHQHIPGNTQKPLSFLKNIRDLQFILKVLTSFHIHTDPETKKRCWHMCLDNSHYFHSLYDRCQSSQFAARHNTCYTGYYTFSTPWFDSYFSIETCFLKTKMLTELESAKFTTKFTM